VSERPGERPDRPPFTRLVDLASARFGGEVLLANDEFFAPKERLLLPDEPVFREGEYTDRGKWMDGWETRRRRTPGHDWCLIRLGLPGVIRGVEVDTRHFRGNHPGACSLEACALEACALEAGALETGGRPGPGGGGARAGTSRSAPAGAPAADPERLLASLELPDREPPAGEPPTSSSSPSPPSSTPPDPNRPSGTRPTPTWREILPRSPLEGDTRHFFGIGAGPEPGSSGAGPEPDAGDRELRATHLLFRIFPDGGVARLRVYGEVRPDWERILAGGGPGEAAGEATGHAVELAGLHRGGRIVAASDGTFADPRNLLLPGPARHMGEGWETRRRRGPGHDWAIIALGRRAAVSEVVVDTRHFRGNYPESCSLEALDATGAGPDPLAGADPAAGGTRWRPLLGRTPLEPDTEHRFREELDAIGPITHVRFNIHPDGGVSRLRVRGRPEASGRDRGTAAFLDALPREEAAPALRSCCASGRWVERMLRLRPFGDDGSLFAAALQVWWSLDAEDWLEAFAAHPRIGERAPPAGDREDPPAGDREAADGGGAAGSGKADGGDAGGPARRSSEWSRREQAGVSGSDVGTRRALAEGNRAYEERFGHVFLIFAAGRSGEEMLAELRDRLENDPDEELRIAAREQAAITRHRLEKLAEHPAGEEAKER